MSSGLWGYEGAQGYAAGTDLTGFRVEATDGHIGKVDKHTEDVDTAHVVVDTGPWIFGREVLLPAGTITRIDVTEKTVWVDRTKDEIKNSPEFDKDRHTGDREYHERLEGYYGGSGTAL
ncbi:PRC domain containing protein [Streptomyces sp. TLI_053]|uniref:PRC domain containing protein n=1 Tax=Streptomyces sp. TLI_053 TaxID=1855352 RepID=UPI000ACF9890|nr:PRC domain containing protein [Streptomyces sp. TLI_053]